MPIPSQIKLQHPILLIVHLIPLVNLSYNANKEGSQKVRNRMKFNQTLKNCNLSITGLKDKQLVEQHMLHPIVSF